MGNNGGNDRIKFEVNQTTGETSEKSGNNTKEIHNIGKFEDKGEDNGKKTNKKVKFIKNEINISGKEITGIYGNYFDTKNNYGIFDGKLIIKKGKLIIRQFKKTIQYFIEINEGEIEIANDKSVSLNDLKLIYNKNKQEFVSENTNFNFNSLDIDLGNRKFSLNDGEIFISDNKKGTEEKKQEGLIGKIKRKVKGLLP